MAARRRRWTRPGLHPSHVYGCEPGFFGECALYRFFDREGRLLYVGITSVPAYRFSAHSGSPWMGDAFCYTTKMYPSRDAARQAETAAIRTEHPIWNKAGVLR